MCGIVGAVAQRDVVPILIEGLRRLEYRGYDSAGVAVHQGGELKPARSTSRVAELEANVAADGVQGGIGAYIGYSPYCVPRVVEGVKCVIVNEALRDIEPMAWDFVMNFARDNELCVVEIGAPPAI